MSSIKDKLVARAYQEEIFEQARHENVIAALETGSGKTLIAALLIKWMMAQPTLSGKKIIFLVPKVPLVEQQRAFLTEQTPLVVRGYTGSMGTESWNKARWAEEFAQSDCLVMIAQVFKDILVHGYWGLDRISLLIFDECHHAQKNHTYRMIMADHYDLSTDKPKIFGMTASPVWNSKNPSASIQTLQRNLSAKVVAVREHSETLGQHMNRPTEVIERFSTCKEDYYASYYKPTLWEQLRSVEVINIPKLSIQALQTRYTVTLNELGPAGADYFVLSHVKKAMREDSLYDDAYIPVIPKSPRGYALSSKNISLDPKPRGEHNGCSIVLAELRTMLCDFDRQLLFDRRALPSEWISPKLQAAVNILVKHRSDTFQGIIFVGQRQLATTLSWILTRIAETKDWIRCGELTGHGEGSTNNEGVKGMGIKAQSDIVQSFKSGKLNLLVTTSVGEEGLDFPACELVIRYDSVHHMVGYIQSRGRARQQKSTYVLMVDENDATEVARYESFRQAEPELKAVYQTMNVPGSSSDLDEDENADVDEEDPQDIASRESYYVPSTGAMLTYSSAISLLSHLCALIPKDAYTPTMQPKYTGSFQATVCLPRALPLPSNKLTFRGPLKRTKREAKRAVAFIAVRELHRLGVFDDHLSPITPQKGDGIEDADGQPIAKVSDVDVMMDVLVASPWKPGPPWYLQTLSIGDRVCTGLVSGICLPEVGLMVQGKNVQVCSRSATSPFELISTRLELLDRFTKMGIWWRVTGSPVTSRVGCFLVPLTSLGAIDWPTMEKAVVDERGSYDWTEITEKDEGKLVLMNCRRTGRPLRFVRFRPELSLDSRPDLVDTEGMIDTYAQYFELRYPPRAKLALSAEKMVAFSPPAGRIIEVSEMSRRPSSAYDLRASQSRCSTQEASTFLLPESFCRQASSLNTEIINAFQVFGPVCQRLCDVFRAREARRFLTYPPIPDDIVVEALTLPCANTSFNNQRLETIGDSVLKLSVVVYIFNKFPNKHEGQLTALKSNSVSNRLLLARAKEVQLEHFLSCENRNLRTWPFVQSPDIESSSRGMVRETIAFVRRRYPRRSLQDCMEASLGAAYVTGGINLALQTGTALGLCFGGSIPWPERYPLPEAVPSAALFNKLQEDLHYTFRNGSLLLEAVKHPSFDGNEGGSCYQRLEFLGDAVIELVVTTYLYNKFPDAQSGQLTWARARAICNATLAALAVKRLSLHKYLLANNVDLNHDVKQEADALLTSEYEDVALNDWKYDPPKTLGDIFESVVGAVFVDCGFNYPTVVPIIETLMEDVLILLHPDIPRDPVTKLLEWVTKAGCRKAKFQRMQSNPLVKMKDGIAVLVHDHIVAGPIIATKNKPLVKGLVAEAAMAVLADDASEFALRKVCECMRMEGGDEDEPSDLPERNVREKDLDVESTEGFAVAGRVRLTELVETEDKPTDAELSDEESEDQEVELLLSSPISVTSEVDSDYMDCS